MRADYRDPDIWETIDAALWRARLDGRIDGPEYYRLSMGLDELPKWALPRLSAACRLGIDYARTVDALERGVVAFKVSADNTRAQLEELGRETQRCNGALGDAVGTTSYALQGLGLPPGVVMAAAADVVQEATETDRLAREAAQLPTNQHGDPLTGDALVWHHLRKGSSLEELRNAASKADSALSQRRLEHSGLHSGGRLPLTPTETAQAIWADQDPEMTRSAATSLRARMRRALEAEGERLRLNEVERACLAAGRTNVARTLWCGRTGGDTETWSEAQAHAWHVLRRGDATP